MAHRSYVRGAIGSGLWASVAVSAAEFEKFDDANFSCIDGDRGGNWAPAALLEVGGAGFKVTGPALVSLSPIFTVAGQSLFSGGIVCANIVQFSGAPTSFDSTSPVTFSGAVSLLSTLTVGSSGVIVHAGSSGDLFQSNATCEFQSGSFLELDVGSELHLNGDIVGTTGHFKFGYIGFFDSGAWLKNSGLISIESGGLLEVKGSGGLSTDASSNTTFGGNVTFGASAPATLVENAFSVTGAGHINERLKVVTTNAGADFTIADGDVFIVGNSGLSANQPYSLLGTGAVGGTTGQAATRMRWSSSNVTYSVTLTQPDHFTAIATIAGAPTSGQYYWVDLIWSGSVWLICGGQLKP